MSKWRSSKPSEATKLTIQINSQLGDLYVINYTTCSKRVMVGQNICVQLTIIQGRVTYVTL